MDQAVSAVKGLLSGAFPTKVGHPFVRERRRAPALSLGLKEKTSKALATLGIDDVVKGKSWLFTWNVSLFAKYVTNQEKMHTHAPVHNLMHTDISLLCSDQRCTILDPHCLNRGEIWRFREKGGPSCIGAPVAA